MVKTLFRLIILGVVIAGLALVLSPSLIKGAGNAFINAINGSSAQGIAQMIPAAKGNTVNLLLQISGLAPNTHYEISLDQEHCGGKVIQDVGQITTGPDGTATVNFNLLSLGKAFLHPIWMDIHQGTTTSGSSVACGQVQVDDSLLSPSTTSSSSGKTSPAGQSTIQNQEPPTIENELPDTGAGPATRNSYDNYTFPRKY